MIIPVRLTCFVALFFPIFSEPASADDRRVALAIGIDHYDKLPENAQLSVAVADAKRIQQTLESLEKPFEVTLVENPDFEGMADAVEKFVAGAAGAECVLIYFAGHGIEYDGLNFLIPRDIDVGFLDPADGDRTRRLLGRRAMSLQDLLDDVEATKAGVKVLILDACRDNPLKVKLPEGNQTRSFGEAGGGLASVVAPAGMLISYSADAGQKANDGLFTEILCRNLQTRGSRIMEVFAKTREEVMERSRALKTSSPGAVFHEPAEYNKLTHAGLQFQFAIGQAESDSDEESMKKDRELEELRRKVAAMEAQAIKNDEKELENEKLKLEALQRQRQEEDRRRKELETLAQSARSYEVAYGGSDGVSLRSRPNGDEWAVMYDQSYSFFEQVPGSEQASESGLLWIFGSMEGWMAIRKIERGYDYAVDNGDGTLTMTWDGGGDPGDAFISLRSSIDGYRLAKMFRGSQLVVVDSSRYEDGGYQWIKVRLIGWAARKSPKGTTLLRER